MIGSFRGAFRRAVALAGHANPHKLVVSDDYGQTDQSRGEHLRRTSSMSE
jgi:hypothetical protein